MVMLMKSSLAIFSHAKQYSSLNLVVAIWQGSSCDFVFSSNLLKLELDLSLAKGWSPITSDFVFSHFSVNLEEFDIFCVAGPQSWDQVRNRNIYRSTIW